MSETSFRQAWGVLQANAQKLRNQTDPDIDELLAIVTASIQAHKVCDRRIQAVEKALEEALRNSGAERPAAAEAGSGAAAAASAARGNPEGDRSPP